MVKRQPSYWLRAPQDPLSVESVEPMIHAHAWQVPTQSLSSESPIEVSCSKLCSCTENDLAEVNAGGDVSNLLPPHRSSVQQNITHCSEDLHDRLGSVL